MYKQIEKINSLIRDTVNKNIDEIQALVKQLEQLDSIIEGDGIPANTKATLQHVRDEVNKSLVILYKATDELITKYKELISNL
jgi:phage-related tail protein